MMVDKHLARQFCSQQFLPHHRHRWTLGTKDSSLDARDTKLILFFYYLRATTAVFRGLIQMDAKKISGRSRSRQLRVHDGYDFVQSTRDMY
jgi:hypothetical protein